MSVGCAQLDFEWGVAFEVGEAEELGEHAEIVFAAMDEFGAGFGVEYVKVVCGFEHADMFANKKEVPIQHVFHWFTPVNALELRFSSSVPLGRSIGPNLGAVNLRMFVLDFY